MPQTDAKVDWFDRVWEHREEVLYPSLFGSSRRGIFPIQAEILTGIFKQESFDPRWLHQRRFRVCAYTRSRFLALRYVRHVERLGGCFDGWKRPSAARSYQQRENSF